MLNKKVSAVFQDYRILCLQLRSLCGDVFSVFVGAFLLYTINVVASCTLSLYIAATLIISNEINNRVIAFGTMLVLILSVINLLLNRCETLCDAVSIKRLFLNRISRTVPRSTQPFMNESEFSFSTEIEIRFQEISHFLSYPCT